MTTETSKTPVRLLFAGPVRIPNRFKAYWAPNCDSAYDDVPDYLWSEEVPSCALAAPGDAPLTEAEWSAFQRDNIPSFRPSYLDFLKCRWPNLFRAINQFAEITRLLCVLDDLMRDSLRIYYEHSRSRERRLERAFTEDNLSFTVSFTGFRSFGGYLTDIDRARQSARNRADGTKEKESSTKKPSKTFDEVILEDRIPDKVSIATLPDMLRGYLLLIRESREKIAARRVLIETVNSEWQREYEAAKATIVEADALFAELQGQGLTDTTWPNFEPSTRTNGWVGFHSPAASFFDVEPRHQHKHDDAPRLEMSAAAVSIKRAADAIVKARHEVRELEGGKP